MSQKKKIISIDFFFYFLEHNLFLLQHISLNKTIYRFIDYYYANYLEETKKEQPTKKMVLVDFRLLSKIDKTTTQ